MSETKQALGPNQEKWLKALESGEYPQGRGSLCRGGAYCCLGVGCEVFGVPVVGELDGEKAYQSDREGYRHFKFAPPAVVESLGLKGNSGPIWLPGEKPDGLTSMNDDGKPFAEIAAFCRAHPEAVFIEPR